LLLPNEKKEVEWRIRVNSPLEKNQFLIGEYKVFSLQEELTHELKVIPNDSAKEKANVKLVEIIPIIRGTNLEIEVVLENLGEENDIANVFIAETNISGKAVIPAQEREKIYLVIENFKQQPYEVYITSDSFSTSTNITPQGTVDRPTTDTEEEINIVFPDIVVEQESFIDFISSEKAFLVLIAGAGVLILILLLKGLFSRKSY
jgi:hypothetical protein